MFVFVLSAFPEAWAQSTPYCALADAVVTETENRQYHLRTRS